MGTASSAVAGPGHTPIPWGQTGRSGRPDCLPPAPGSSPPLQTRSPSPMEYRQSSSRSFAGRYGRRGRACRPDQNRQAPGQPVTLFPSGAAPGHPPDARPFLWVPAPADGGMVGAWSMSLPPWIILPDTALGPATMKGACPLPGQVAVGGDRWLVFLYVVDTGDKLAPHPGPFQSTPGRRLQ